MPKEAKARILINDLLRRSGWRFFDDETGPANIALEALVKLKKKILDDLGDDFEKTTHGYVDYSNGNLHYFWDLEQGNPVLVTEFPTRESLDHFHAFKPNPDGLIHEKVDADYVAITQDPNYANDPRWNDPTQREAYIKDAELKLLRRYQLRAVGPRLLHQSQTVSGKREADAMPPKTDAIES